MCALCTDGYFSMSRGARVHLHRCETNLIIIPGLTYVAAGLVNNVRHICSHVHILGRMK